METFMFVALAVAGAGVLGLVITRVVLFVAEWRANRPTAAAPEKGPFLTGRRVGQAALTVLVVPALGLVYAVVIAEGLRTLVPSLGVTLFRLRAPFLRNRVDLAIVFSQVLLVIVGLCWWKLMRALLASGEKELSLRSWFLVGGTSRAHRTEWVLRTVATVMLLADSVVFFNGIRSDGAWGGGGAPLFTALVLTALYASLLLFVAWLHATLSE